MSHMISNSPWREEEGGLKEKMQRFANWEITHCRDALLKPLGSAL